MGEGELKRPTLPCTLLHIAFSSLGTAPIITSAFPAQSFCRTIGSTPKPCQSTPPPSLEMLVWFILGSNGRNIFESFPFSLFHMVGSCRVHILQQENLHHLPTGLWHWYPLHTMWLPNGCQYQTVKKGERISLLHCVCPKPWCYHQMVNKRRGKLYNFYPLKTHGISALNRFWGGSICSPQITFHILWWGKCHCKPIVSFAKLQLYNTEI